MRIVLISDCFSPRVGGIETHVEQLANALCRAGHEVRVVTATRAVPPALTDSLSTGYEVFRLSIPLPFDLPVNPFAVSALRRHLLWAQAVHIHFGMISPFAKLAANTCVSLGVKAVLTWHSHLGDAASWYRFYIPFSRWTRAGFVFTAVSAVAAQALEACARAGVDSDGTSLSVGVLPNPLDLSRWESVRLRRLERLRSSTVPQGEFGTEPFALRAVNVSRLSGRKRLPALFRSFPSAPWELTVFGGGRQHRLLRWLIRRLSHKRIRLGGKVGAADLADFFTFADCFVSLTVFEAFGIAALEARCAGLPVFYREGSGVSDFISPGFDGVVLGSDADLTAVLDFFAAHPLRLRELQLRAAATAPDFSWPTLLPNYLRFYGLVSAV